MKTSDGYFRGFPALWNIVAFYLFLARPSTTVAVALIAAFVILTFLPIHFVHPLRANSWMKLNVAMLLLGATLSLVALFYHLVPPSAVIYGLYAVGIYFIAIGLIRPAEKGA
jgi:phosphatidylcholine synthase